MKATTRALRAAVDLNDIAAGDGVLFVRAGVGIAGRGEAARVRAEEAMMFLRGIAHDGPPDAPGPIAVGCIPFHPNASAELIVPATVVRKGADGTAWITHVHTDGDVPADVPEGLAPSAPPVTSAGAFRIRPLTPIATYLAAVESVREAVARGDLVKAVVARDVLVEADTPIDVHGLLLRLRTTFPSSYRYSVDGFVGASPELLVEVDGDRVRSHPLAGTVARTGDPEVDARLAAELVSSAKNQLEHRVVIDMVHDTLLPWCSYLDWEPEPSVVQVANVQHLATMVEGRLSHPRPDAVTLVRALSPTPALGGHPRDAALALLDQVEGLDRGRFGGAVGWIDAFGNGTWAVAIRCAELSADRRQARLLAGGGIVADSEPLAELAETQAKLQAMLGAIVRP